MSWRDCGEGHLRSERQDNERQGSVERKEGSVDTAYISSCPALLRDESKKREAWEDMQKLKQKYDEIAQDT